MPLLPRDARAGPEWAQPFDWIPIPLAECDTRAGVILYANQAAARLLGAPRDRLVGRPWPAFVAPPDRRPLWHTVIAALERGSTDIVTTARLVDASGGVCGTRQHVHLARRGRDTRAEIAVLESAGLLPADAAAGDAPPPGGAAETASSRPLSPRALALGRLGHALNNPLQVIVGNADLLADDSGPRRQERVDAVRDAAIQAASIVRSLQLFLRERTLRPVKLRLGGVVHAVVNGVRTDLERAGIRVQCEVDSACEVVADGPLVAEVITQLVRNAEEAMRASGGGALRLAVERRDARVRLSVEDSGPGVPASIRASLFEPLATTKLPGEGAGLGLAMCRDIVADHGGVMGLVDLPSGGSAFIVDLPAAPDDGRGRGSL